MILRLLCVILAITIQVFKLVLKLLEILIQCLEWSLEHVKNKSNYEEVY